jgi:hypothetical protein
MQSNVKRYGAVMPESAYASQAEPKPPSAPWFGALNTALMFLGAAWILVYTMLSVPFVEALGPWNYVGVLLLVVASTLLGKAWRGAAYERPTRTSRV